MSRDFSPHAVTSLDTTPRNHGYTLDQASVFLKKWFEVGVISWLVWELVTNSCQNGHLWFSQRLPGLNISHSRVRTKKVACLCERFIHILA